MRRECHFQGMEVALPCLGIACSNAWNRQYQSEAVRLVMSKRRKPESNSMASYFALITLANLK